MKKIIKFSVISLSLFALLSCSNKPVTNEQVNSISSIVKTNTKDNVDYYTITFTNGSTTTFTITNGINGEQGIQGIPGKDGHTPQIEIGSNGNWFIDGNDTNIKAQGVDGEKGEQGDKGEPGKDGATPIIGENGNWFINGIDTGKPSKGKDGQSTSLTINEEGYRVINGEVTNFKAQGNVDEIYQAMEHYFDYKDIFITEKETLKNPSFNYTTSTFSGWIGSIGSPKTINSISFRVKARDIPITSIKVYLNKVDKTGEQIISETLKVNIEPKTDQEIIRTLKNEFINTKNETIYFGYACNALCDVYSNFSSSSIIPENEPQAIQCYITNGQQPENLSKFIDVAGKPCRYIYVKLGKVKKAFIPNENLKPAKEKINVFLPKKYYLAVNDNFQLFYRGVIQAVNPYNYHIKIKARFGKAFPRYYEWKPTIDNIGEHQLTLEVRDNNNNLLGSDTTTLVVNKAKETSESKNILCMGDSLTAGGQWVKEGFRRFSQVKGNPIGDNLNYINCVGTKSVVSNEVNVGYEGYGGWTWKSYLSEKSPFYDQESNEINFKKYSELNYFGNLDYFYILLTWNGHSESFKTDYKLNEGHFLDAAKLIDRIHLDYPEAKIRLLGLQMPSQNGGMGTNYDVPSCYGDAYGMLVSAMHYNKTLEEFCEQEKYKSFINYIDVAGQFDTDYNMPSTDKPVNNRNDKTEIIGSNGVHPTLNGYYQIGDAFYRSLYTDFKI